MSYKYNDLRGEPQGQDVRTPDGRGGFRAAPYDIPGDIPNNKSEYGPETAEVPEIAEDTEEYGEDVIDVPEITEDTLSGAEIPPNAEVPEITEDVLFDRNANADELPEAAGIRDAAEGYAEMGRWPRAGDIPSVEEALSDTNPNYELGEEWQVNCQRCVPAYEMRRRGYDVSAMPCVDDEDYLSVCPFDVWVNPDIICCMEDDRNTIVKEMSRWEDGARAQVVVIWKDTLAGHTFIAEKMNGEIRFVDPQDGNPECSEYFDEIEPGMTRFCRIDNLAPSEMILECCKEMGNND